MRFVLLVFITPLSGLGGLLIELRRALKNECPHGQALQATGTLLQAIEIYYNDIFDLISYLHIINLIAAKINIKYSKL